MKLKKNTLICPQGWQIYQAFLWTAVGSLLGFTRGTWKWQWDRHNLRDMLFEAFHKIPSHLMHEITSTHTAEICSVCGITAVSIPVHISWGTAQLLLLLCERGHQNYPELTASCANPMVPWWRGSICWFIKHSPWFPIPGNSKRFCTAQSAVLDCRMYEASSFSHPPDHLLYICQWLKGA